MSLKIKTLSVVGFCVISIFLFGSLLDIGYRGEAGQEKNEVTDEALFTVMEDAIIVPGLQEGYTFLVVNDMHIAVESDNIPAEFQDAVKKRHEMFISEAGVYSSQLWLQTAEALAAYDADAVLLAGDMMDFMSAENMDCLKYGLDKLTMPYMYVRADHDYGNWYYNMDSSTVKEEHQALDDDADYYAWEFDELILFGINNSTRQISAAALDVFKLALDKAKPILIVTHVPFLPENDGTLAEKSRQVWQNRVLLWGDNGFYYPDQTTREFMDLMLAPESTVVGVISGHLHFQDRSMLNERIVQIVYEPSYLGYIGILNIVGS